MNQLESLKKYTVVVADTGDIEAIRKHKPQDATTNPSLLLKAAPNPAYRSLADQAAEAARRLPAGAERREGFMDHLAVAFGNEILKIIPGRVSTEVDAQYSFDTDATIRKAKNFIELYAAQGVDKARVLIKIGSTWEGIKAAEQLEKEGIHCNLTLLFSFAQAIACAEAGVTLISPFVGRIYDWHKKDRGVEDIALDEDPGVASVRRIYAYYKRHGYQTEVMGASFRKAGQVTRLAGCDLLTISPDILEQLEATDGEITRALDPATAPSEGDDKIHLDKKGYRWLHNGDPMAVDRLADGIRRFDADARKLESWAAEFLS